MPRVTGETTGEILRRLRGKRPASVVADAVGVEERTLLSYERNERVPRDETKQLIADYYNKSVGYIFFYPKRTRNVSETSKEAENERVEEAKNEHI